jgi:hypothetical protein
MILADVNLLVYSYNKAGRSTPRRANGLKP